MEVFVSAPNLRLSNVLFPDGSAVRDVLYRCVQEQGVSPNDFYVITNGRLCALEDPIQHGAIYHLEPRLCGGKGGFGSMLRALGAQIEKTTNREACRDLSGRRLRDVNHEKEMAEWLKKQAEREAEKEQRRLERLQRKLSEPKHQFTDPQFQQQCHDLSERLEDSVLKGLQASSSGQVKVDDVLAAKRLNSDQSQGPEKKKQKRMTAAKTSACLWTGLELLSSEDDEDEDCPSTSSLRCGTTVNMTTQREEAEPEQSSSSSFASDHSSSPTHHSPKSSEPSTDQSPAEPCADGGPAEPCADGGPAEPCADGGPAEPCADGGPAEPCADGGPAEPCADGGPAEPCADGGPAEPCTEPCADGGPAEPCTEPCADGGPAEPCTEPCADGGPAEPCTEPCADGGPADPSTEPCTIGRPAETCTDQMSRPSEESSSSSQQQQQGRPPLDLSSVSSVHQLESLGLDVLKEELISRGMKCGGTLSERAARLFSVKGLTTDQINPALLTKPGKSRRK
ncbi:splicing regulator SDE2 isoform X2 [Channa argus]|uniref:splicing regulator SDE2 isoform X2 n=1 Tax=Channa argus TaxID=215402 RepID=UPI003520F729